MREQILRFINDYLQDNGLAQAGEVVTEKTMIANLKMDSLDRMEFILTLEEQFDISVPDEAVEKVITVGEVVDLVVDLTEKPKAMA